VTVSELNVGVWRKSSHSGAENDCVEIAVVDDSTAAVRDSKNPAGPRLEFHSARWAAFIDHASDRSAGC
jgi:Domain of unknown function (DUF397)